MKKLLIIIWLLLFTGLPKLLSQERSGIEVYLITCNPGIETYSHYGHSALRIVNPAEKSDFVYNWGMFDFDTPNFAWKFAKGRLDYKLGAETFMNFLRIYIYEQRSVFQQKINLEPPEIEKLMTLITENLKPENIKYRYDFFYDDCSTRIRDLLEKSLGEKLIYPPAEKKDLPSFRLKVGEYQKNYQWLSTGIDLIMGISADKKASIRDQMFLPFDLRSGLSEALVKRDGKMIPLLSNSQAVLEFDLPEFRNKIYTIPLTLLSLILILAILFSTLCKRPGMIKFVDILLFTVFSVLALLMIFFNFFADHQQMKWNLNIVWLSPFLIVCLISIVLNKEWQIWFKLAFYSTLIFLVPLILLHNIYNRAFIPFALIIILRTSIRAGFAWNPFYRLNN
jgi:hypothetical protein